MRNPFLRLAALTALTAAASACTRDQLVSAPESPLLGTAPMPVVTQLSPSSTPARTDSLVLRINGRYFGANAVVRWHNRELVPFYRSSSTLQVRLREPEIGAGDTVAVRVYTPEGGESAPLPFTVVNPAPRLDSLSTRAITGGGGDVPLKVFGAGFVRTSTVMWDGQPLRTRRLDAATLEATVDAFRLGQAGTRSVWVFNEQPGGGTTRSDSVTVTVPPPVLTGLSTRAVNGPDAFTLGVYGRNLFPQTVVLWNGMYLATTYVGPGRLRAAVPAGAANGGTDIEGRSQVRVFTPGVGWSDTLLVRRNPIPYPGQHTVVGTVESTLAVDMAWSSTTGRLYALVSLGTSAGAVYGIDPATAAVVDTIPVYSRPRSLAVSADGRTLWIATDAHVRRIRVPEMTELPGVPYATSTSDLEASPDSADVLALARGYGTSVAGIDESGAVRPGSLGMVQGTAAAVVEFGGAHRVLWGFDPGTGTLRRMRLATVPEPDTAATGLIPSGARDVVYAAGRLYAATGDVVDTAPIERLGACPADGHAVRPDPESGRMFILRHDGIAVCDLNTLRYVGQLNFMLTLYNYTDRRYQLVRWGTDGLAFYDEQRIVILRTPFASY